jgi:hypothetical protein
MAQSDRLIPEGDRCKTCSGAGWKWWTPPASATGPAPQDEAPQESKWIVCRECIGTGRTDQKGRKRIKPDVPAGG